MRKYLIKKLKALRQLFVTCRFLCGHIQWVETGNVLGSKLHEHKCLKCGKSIYRDTFHPPMSFVENCGYLIMESEWNEVKPIETIEP